MTARPIMSEDILNTILRTFVVAEYKPDMDMLKCLARATGKNADYIEINYSDVYEQIKADGGNPNDPLPFIIP